jgi:oligopeptide/dipeptide ABC transporter ATP-binding protein
VYDAVAEGLRIHGYTGDERPAVAEALSRAGLRPPERFFLRYPHELSGGQRQRVVIAGALVLEPELIVADEPVASLDASVRGEILALLLRLRDELGLSALVVTHDLGLAWNIADRVAVMYLGRIVELAPSRELNMRPLHPYSVALLSAVPIPDPKVERRRRRIILKGDVPSPVNPPSGCHFHTRCWLRERLGNPEQCSAEIPLLRTLSTGHEVACHFAEEVDGSREQLQATGRGGAEALPAGGLAAAAAVPVDVAAAPAGATTVDPALFVASPYATPHTTEGGQLADIRLPVQPDPVVAPDSSNEA